MCIILVGNVTKEQHEAARVQNGDGFSLFTQKQGLIKAPTAKQVKEALGDFGIWHYRIATSGDRKSVQNIHPLPRLRRQVSAVPQRNFRRRSWQEIGHARTRKYVAKCVTEVSRNHTPITCRRQKQICNGGCKRPEEAITFTENG